jgi:RNA polymerase sigma factor (sigma-70 family)
MDPTTDFRVRGTDDGVSTLTGVRDHSTLWTRDALVRAHAARVYRLAFRLTGDQQDAEDLTQDVFIRVFRYLPSYRPGVGTFAGWLHRVTTNPFLDQVPQAAVASRDASRFSPTKRSPRSCTSSSALSPPASTAAGCSCAPHWLGVPRAANDRRTPSDQGSLGARTAVTVESRAYQVKPRPRQGRSGAR